MGVDVRRHVCRKLELVVRADTENHFISSISGRDHHCTNVASEPHLRGVARHGGLGSGPLSELRGLKFSPLISWRPKRCVFHVIERLDFQLPRLVGVERDDRAVIKNFIPVRMNPMPLRPVEKNFLVPPLGLGYGVVRLLDLPQHILCRLFTLRRWSLSLFEFLSLCHGFVSPCTLTVNESAYAAAPALTTRFSQTPLYCPAGMSGIVRPVAYEIAVLANVTEAGAVFSSAMVAIATLTPSRASARSASVSGEGVSGETHTRGARYARVPCSLLT